MLGDVVLDIDVIPNIARCASIMGTAREVAALTRADFVPPSDALQMDGPPIDGRVEIATENPELNPRFVTLLIEGIEQGPSPYWMQHRLHLAGQRPIGNVVDVSNYVMLEVGQPNHTFDYDLLRQRADGYADGGPVRIVTRLAHEGERLTTLDGAEQKLRTNQILVTDPAGALSVGGVMGGRDSEISAETSNVLLEAAAWEPRSIRRTQRQLGVHTESGFRFSRGRPPQPGPARRQARGRAAAAPRRRRRRPRHRPTTTRNRRRPSPSTLISPTCAGSAAWTSAQQRLRICCGAWSSRSRRRTTPPPCASSFRPTVSTSRVRTTWSEEVCRIYGYDRIPSTVLSDVLPPQRGKP